MSALARQILVSVRVLALFLLLNILPSGCTTVVTQGPKSTTASKLRELNEIVSELIAQQTEIPSPLTVEQLVELAITKRFMNREWVDARKLHLDGWGEPFVLSMLSSRSRVSVIIKNGDQSLHRYEAKTLIDTEKKLVISQTVVVER